MPGSPARASPASLDSFTGSLQVLDKSLWQQVAAFQWLTGWPQENLTDPLHGPSIAVLIFCLQFTPFTALSRFQAQQDCFAEICALSLKSSELSESLLWRVLS